MITIGDRVKEAIDYMEKNQLEHALTATCIALDITAQEISGKEKSARSDFKKFLSDYLWIIQYMGIPGIMGQSIKIGFSHPNIKPDINGNCRIEDIVYHVIRCKLIHSTGLDSKIRWQNNSFGIDASGNLILPNKFIWGLIGAIVFCPQNKNAVINKNYWIGIDEFKFQIQDIWGRLDIAANIISKKLGTPN